MAVFTWRRRPTRHFGEQWVPFAELSLLSSTGRWRTFSVQVDTGAVVSVLRRSAVELLGIEATTGRSISLVSVGGLGVQCQVYHLQAKLSETAEFGLRVALAERDDVPNLLGRLDILDRFRLELDPEQRVTRFGPIVRNGPDSGR